MNKIKFILGLFMILMFTSCLDDFRELNTDDEMLVTTDPKNVFTGATENFNNVSRQHLMGKYSGVMQYMQYIVNYNGAQEGIYIKPAQVNKPSPYLPYYNDYYTQIGIRLNYLVNTVIPLNPDKDRYQDIAAISNILEAYEAWLMFDVYGAAPYHEAFKLASEGISKPRYDLYQEDINGTPMYKVFDQKVKDNVAVLSNSTDQHNLGANDYFYGGDVDKWIKFGNTLRIKMAQRLEIADTDFYNSVINEALANSGGIISNHDESNVYNHPNEHNNNTDDTHILTYQYAASRALVNFLDEYDDPRLPLLVRRNGFGMGNNNELNDAQVDSLAKYFPNYETRYSQWTDRFVGMSANPDSANSTYSNSAYYTLPFKDNNGVDRNLSIRHNSQIESRYYVKNGGNIGTQVTARDKEDAKYSVSTDEISLFTPLITYPETCFMMAEIAFKAGASKGGKDANAWFREGIRASMEQYQAWGEKMKVPAAMDANSDFYRPIAAADIDAYLAKPEFQSVTLEKIISQQWVNLFMRPEEAWATWKRTGLPAFKDQPEPENGVAYLEVIASGSDMLKIPRRAALGSPNTENIDNYRIAIEELKSDPKYGDSFDDTGGRIWWDMKGF